MDKVACSARRPAHAPLMQCPKPAWLSRYNQLGADEQRHRRTSEYVLAPVIHGDFCTKVVIYAGLLCSNVASSNNCKPAANKPSLSPESQPGPVLTGFEWYKGLQLLVAILIEALSGLISACSTCVFCISICSHAIPYILFTQMNDARKH